MQAVSPEWYVLEPGEYAAARPLFHHLEHHLFITALMEGTIAGSVFVDHPTRPHAALVAYHHALCLAGDPALPGFNAALRQFLMETIIPPRLEAGWEAFVIHYAPAGWLEVLTPVCAPYRVIESSRQYYETVLSSPAPGVDLPAGFEIHLVSPEFLASGRQGMEVILDEMCSERTSVEDFLSKSFGLVLTYEDQVAGFCMSEYNTGSRCEIGIATFEPYQRRGLATQMTWAFMAHALARGYTQIGWHCWSKNLPSGATAVKAGLKLKHTDPTAVVLLKEK
jgi:hypothetical protein